MVQQKVQVGYMNQGCYKERMLQGPVHHNAGNLYAQTDANWYALDVSYTNDYRGSELAVVPRAGVLFLYVYMNWCTVIL